MSSVLARSATVLPARFDFLMELHAENYHRLARLFGAHRLDEGGYRSDYGDGMALWLDVSARQPYTVDCRMTYASTDRDSGLPAPSAELRLYLDAELAEVMHCRPGLMWWQALRSVSSGDAVMRHRLRMATFLGRWLDYLGDEGHSLATLRKR